jgi:hypothetical protein
MLGFPNLASRLEKARRWVVDVAPSWRLRRDQVEDERVDVTGCVRPCYPYFTILYVLGHRTIVVFESFAWVYKYDPICVGLLAISLVLFDIS